MAHTLHRTAPDDEHRVVLVQDSPRPGDRTYEVWQRGRWLVFSGEELESLAGWWVREERRRKPRSIGD